MKKWMRTTLSPSGGEGRPKRHHHSSDLHSSRSGDDMGLLVDSIDDGGDEEHASPLPGELQVFSMPEKRFLFAFPERLESFLAPFDDAIIKICQKPKGPLATAFSLFITVLVTIEVGIPVPFVMFVVGWDGLGTIFTYLAILTCLISQIPKRFLWRFRPYMVNRADRRRKDLTSSFPSRAVTCAVVYSFAICWAYMYRIDKGFLIEWWMPLLFVTLILLSSFARINLGVHYPSDCVAGVFQGIVICGIAFGLWATNTLGCSTCRDLDCYSVGDHRILWNQLDRANWITFSILAGCLTILVIISIVKPIEFWVKCDRVYGTLLPGVVFQVVFLCPSNYNDNCSLPEPDKHLWYSYLYGIGLAGLFTVIPLVTKGKWPIVACAFLSASSFSAVVWWRLFITS